MGRISCFIFGIGVGVLSASIYFSKKINQIVSKKVREEIKEIKKEISIIQSIKEPEKNTENKKEETIIFEKPNTHITAYNNREEKEMKDTIPFAKEEKTYPDPYIITEDECYDNEEYDRVGCTYNYINDTLITDINEVIEDIDFTVKYDNLTSVEECDIFEIIVRNEYLQTDYIITLEREIYD